MAIVQTEKKKELMLEALEAELGNITRACKRINVGRRTHYDWMARDAEYRKMVTEISEQAIDFAEEHLLKQIKAGDTTATIFFLKTRGKHRGYEQVANVKYSVTRDETPQERMIDWSKLDENTIRKIEEATIVEEPVKEFDEKLHYEDESK